MEMRARLAREWLTSAMTQAEFCHVNRCSTRALREWVSKYCAGRRPEAKARAIIDSAIRQLQALRDALDDEEERQVGTSDVIIPQQEVLGVSPERSADSEPSRDVADTPVRNDMTVAAVASESCDDDVGVAAEASSSVNIDTRESAPPTKKRGIFTEAFC